MSTTDPHEHVEPDGWRSGLPVPDPNDPHALYGYDAIRAEDGGAEALDFAAMLSIVEPLSRTNPDDECESLHRFQWRQTEKALADSIRIRERIQNIYQRYDVWNLTWHAIAEILRDVCEERGLIPRRAGSKTPESTDRGESTKPETAHNEDFTWVRWFGEEYTFARVQAAIVRELWHEWDAGRGGLTKKRIIILLGKDGTNEMSSIDDFAPAKTFKDHPAWGTMIVNTTKKPATAVYQLVDPTGK